jgi:hypothetical protein
MLWPEIVVLPQPSLRAQRSNPCHEEKKEWIASSQGLLAMTVVRHNKTFVPACYRTTPEINPAFRLGGLMSFFRKQCASLPA